MTVSQRAVKETVKTNETNLVGNLDFLTAIFHDLEDSARPMLASFDGNPNQPPKGAWSGNPLHRDAVWTEDLITTFPYLHFRLIPTVSSEGKSHSFKGFTA